VSQQIVEVPLFPLPRGALLPGELLPLHIFEPRYREMMRRVRLGKRTLAIATLDSARPPDERGRPAVADIVGLGKLVRDELKADGTSDIVLHGWGRARIVEELPSSPFRMVRATPQDDDTLHPVLAFRMRRELLLGLAERLGGISYDVTARFDAGALADRIASALSLSASHRVRMMQAVSTEQRVYTLLELLEDMKHQKRLAELVPALGDFTLRFDRGEDSGR